MKPIGYGLMILGILVAIFGVLQLAWVILTSPDPNPNPAGSGVLMSACLYGGILLIGLGGWAARWIKPPLV
jgi:hypothetical protein